MKCPYCNYNQDKVIDSRETMDGTSVRRRRECINCGKRYTTYEYIEKIPLMVIKKDGRREPFNRSKILSGLLKACEKRPISIDKLESLVSEVEMALQKKFDREVESRYIGELVIDKLSKLDDVAYVRFASVYRQFKDVSQFVKESREILSKRFQSHQG
ncbi:MAG: transcriptional regulator NrdR [Candidatus Omnitrophica bacterium]|nr:transcriptional regulator NrdR [Candidatus Omnitrophota bacterium]MCM8824430.1 transcriptional regulator NrdR [Candidatus Omnitrophota bacterium]MCM8826234.1 transcriptional regulator NrdR [Candidatus Omnitrophota bacterium]